MRRILLAMPLAACACTQLLGLDDAVVENKTRETPWTAPTAVIVESAAPDAAPDAGDSD